MSLIWKGGSSLILSELAPMNTFLQNDGSQTALTNNCLHLAETEDMERNKWPETVRLRNIINILLQENDRFRREKSGSKRQMGEFGQVTKTMKREAEKMKQKLEKKTAILKQLRASVKKNEKHLRTAELKLKELSGQKKGTCDKSVTAKLDTLPDDEQAGWTAALVEILQTEDETQIELLLQLIDDFMFSRAPATKTDRHTDEFHPDSFLNSSGKVSKLSEEQPSAFQVDGYNEESGGLNGWDTAEAQNGSAEELGICNEEKIASDMTLPEGTSSNLENTEIDELYVVFSLNNLQLLRSILQNISQMLRSRGLNHSDDDSTSAEYFDCVSGEYSEDEDICQMPRESSIDKLDPWRNYNCNANNYKIFNYRNHSPRHVGPIESVSLPVLFSPVEERFSLYEHARQIINAHSQTDDLETTQGDEENKQQNCSDVESNRNLMLVLSRSAILANQICERNMFREQLSEKNAEIDALNLKIVSLKQHYKNLDLQNFWLCEALTKEKQEIRDPFPSLSTWVKMATAVAVNVLLVKILRTLFRI